MNIPVVFENENFLALDKPANILSEPHKGSKDFSVVDFLKEKYPLHSKFDPVRFGLLHRLDKETSGLLLVAKNKETFDFLKSLFRERKIKKEYLALSYGWLKEKKSILNFPIGWGGRLKTTSSSSRKPKEAITEIEVIKKLQKEEKYSFLKALPKTGRTNQIRIHLAKIGLPVVGDKIYGRKKNIPKEVVALKRHFLHAFALEFVFLGIRYRMEASLAKDLAGFLVKTFNYKPETFF